VFLSDLCRAGNATRGAALAMLDGGVGWLAGGAVGGAVGFGIRTERWERRTPGAPHVVLAPGGAGIALSFAF
jgi:hypothetical protein